MSNQYSERVDAEEQRRVEAADWLLTLQKPDLPPQTFESWKAWEAVPENRQMFDRVEQLWSAMDRLPAPSNPGAAQLAADTYTGEHTISRWATRRLRRRVVYGSVGLAASVLLAVVLFVVNGGGLRGSSANTVTVETRIGEHREVILSDGSKVELGAKTSVSATLNAQQRTVVLTRGEALFTVARDSRRPFKVTAGGATITALGTAFNVRRREDDRVVVTVTEGVVQVQAGGGRALAKRVERGEQMTYDGEGHVSVPSPVDAVAAVAWREGQLRYSSQPLRVVIEDVNRYSRRRVVLSDAAAAELPYTGTFFERDVEEWIGHLERSYPELEVTPVTAEVDTIYVRTRTASRP